MSNSDSEIDYDDQVENYSDSNSDDNSPNPTYTLPKLMKNPIIKKSSSPIAENIQITTEGIGEAVLKSINLAYVQDMIQCHCCSKYYNKSLIVNDEAFGEQMCKHCLCWLSYAVETRLEFDMKCASIHGFCIAEYILTCHEAHGSETCTRMTDKGGCLLCDYNLNLDIPNILNREMLPRFASILQLNEKASDQIKGNKIKKIMIVDNDTAMHGAEEYFKTAKLVI